MMRTLGLFLIALLVGINPAFATLYWKGLNKNFFTSDVMVGKVAVSVVFVESNGKTDPNTEDWSEARKSQVLNEIMTGLDWWTRQNTNVPLSFVYESQTLGTSYEPITRPYYQESLWIPQLMALLGEGNNTTNIANEIMEEGVGGVGQSDISASALNRFTSTRNYCNKLRTRLNTDWAFMIFVVDSANDSDGKLADGLFAYAYLGGPYMVMTYDNGGYGISNMDVVAAHETGHIFHALDQYAGASSPFDYSSGYFPTINGNHAWSSIANEPNSIMRGGIRWGLDRWAKSMIGWKDENNNNRIDIADQNPVIGVVQESLNADPGKQEFTGSITIPVVARQGNANGNGFTPDTIERVERNINGNGWVEIAGPYGSANVAFRFEIEKPNAGASSISAQSIQIRAFTAFELGIDTSSSGGGGVSMTLNNAHAYPNPYKPNSSLGHTAINFSGLTAHAKVQILSAAGEPVFEATADSTGSIPAWSAVNNEGSKIATGVYFFLITDPTGDEKTGKLAIIR